jgi:hypothetical protein
MNNQDFTTTILVDQTPKQAFDAINNVRGWWSEDIEGSTDEPGSEFDYRYQDIHRCKMKIIEFIPAQKVVWLVTDNYFKFTTDKTEWINTKIIFEILEKDHKTEVRFTHQGLVPDYECYEVCYEAWTYYIQDSLRNLITACKGQPESPSEEDSFNAQLADKFELK